MEITGTGIREFLNQPHKRYFEKNELVKDLPKLIKDATYLGYSEYHKDNDTIIKNRIFLTTALGEETYLIVREDMTGRIAFYSISDSPKVLTGLKKST